MTRTKVFIETKSGKREVSGLRKWVIAVPLVTIAALVVAVAIVFALGLALTVGAMLLVAIPAALALASVALMFGRFETNAD